MRISDNYFPEIGLDIKHQVRLNNGFGPIRWKNERHNYNYLNSSAIFYRIEYIGPGIYTENVTKMQTFIFRIPGNWVPLEPVFSLKMIQNSKQLFSEF